MTSRRTPAAICAKIGSGDAGSTQMSIVLV